MKTYPRKVRRRARHARVPAFSPVPTRGRADGWTPERQARFLAELAITRSVSEAARKVRMSRESVYRLRRREGAESFTAAWYAALGKVTLRRKVTAEERWRRALQGLLKPMIYAGEYVGSREKTDNSALLGHLAHIDRAIARQGGAGGRSQAFAPRSASLSPGAMTADSPSGRSLGAERRSPGGCPDEVAARPFVRPPRMPGEQ